MQKAGEGKSILREKLRGFLDSLARLLVLVLVRWKGPVESISFESFLSKVTGGNLLRGVEYDNFSGTEG